MTTSLVQAGDWVRDRMDNGKLRQVVEVSGATLYMADGGVMGTEEVSLEDIVLESEVTDGLHL